jgi:hypothetical protein
MPNQQNDRVLTRMGARELTSSEVAQVSAGFGGTGCTLTGGPHTQQDIFLRRCPPEWLSTLP